MIIPAAFLQIERRTTRTARPPNTPTMIATDLPTWSSLWESTQNTKLLRKYKFPQKLRNVYIVDSTFNILQLLQ